MTRWLGLAALLALAGCAASGDSGRLEPGQTTYQQVQRRLGEPTRNTITADHGHIATFDAKTGPITLEFGPNGVLRQVNAPGK